MTESTRSHKYTLQDAKSLSLVTTEEAAEAGISRTFYANIRRSPFCAAGGRELTQVNRVIT